MKKSQQDRAVVYYGTYKGVEVPVYKHTPSGDWVNADNCSTIYPFKEVINPIKKIN